MKNCCETGSCKKEFCKCSAKKEDKAPAADKHHHKHSHHDHGHHGHKHGHKHGQSGGHGKPACNESKPATPPAKSSGTGGCRCG